MKSLVGNFIPPGHHVDSIVSYTAVLDVRDATVYFLVRLLMLRRIELARVEDGGHWADRVAHRPLVAPRPERRGSVVVGKA